ncbi:MAG: hypothetical protein HZB31_04350 [Nitrospirae bacterium]|nr:hypothetical protein [Nitrospirota bacterium]
MKMKAVIVMLLLVMVSACSSTQTLSENGKRFDMKKEMGIVIGKSLKRDVFETYGQPSASKILGKYEVMTYSYSKQSFKTSGVGSALLGAVPGVGLVQAGVELQRDRGKDRINMEWQDLSVYVEMATGIVRDFYYHDSDLNGHDESEALYLKATVAFAEKRTDEAVKLLENSISLNSRNHRALNTLAWHCIDLGIDVDRGVKMAQQAVEVFSDSPHNNGTLGMGYFKKGDLQNAEKYLQIAVNLYPVYAPQDYQALQHDKAMLQTVQNQK